ncbi:XRE family transcriptional regulator [Parasedimentitalea marina]|uniref:XRE family transcriptional regulator n=1 Tax=Parasedimentitalea marina TaxID=2483033 RepID=A0A3T0N1Q8_9RHOB|nr:helix-turn-helix transcriptional regulator [Parasedimentitalea marina]AZV77956.1 XRE family transcriptional regulator [Parasedimentitalea marina]
MQNPERSPQDLRNQLSANLLKLTDGMVVSQICKKANISRNQFNRYLTGESFPRPDVLDRICTFFGVDANILLRPLGNAPETPERIVLRHAIRAGRFDCAGDLTLAVMTVRSFYKTYEARCILAQCAGVLSPCDFQMLAEEAGFSDLQPEPIAILSHPPETPKPEQIH